MANIDQPNFDEPREREGFRARRARIGRQLGTERIGISLWELPPGQKAFPYHFHLAEEEVLIVLAGTPSLRTPEGSQTLSTGDVIRFPIGEQGAHQVWNEDEELVRLLAVSTHGTPDIVIYPDSNKLSAAERLSESDGRKHYFRIEDEVDYWRASRPEVRIAGQEMGQEAPQTPADLDLAETALDRAPQYPAEPAGRAHNRTVRIGARGSRGLPFRICALTAPRNPAIRVPRNTLTVADLLLTGGSGSCIDASAIRLGASGGYWTGEGLGGDVVGRETAAPRDVYTKPKGDYTRRVTRWLRQQLAPAAQIAQSRTSSAGSA